MKRLLGLLVPIALLLHPFAAPAQQPFAWRNVNIQGMGYVTGMVIHPDTERAPERIYVRTDIGGAYRYEVLTDRWIPLMDIFGPSQRSFYGVESLALDPARPQDVYAATNGGVLVSHDLGAHWSNTGLSGVYFGSNDLFRGSSGERLVTDPLHPGQLFFASRRDGLWRKAPEGPWEKLPGLPATSCIQQAGRCVDVGDTFVVADPAGGDCPHGTCRIYAGVYGSGVWTSSDSGENWTRIGADPDPLRAAVASDGTLYVTFGGSEEAYSGPGAVRRYVEGRWQDITPGPRDTSYSGISVSAQDSRLVMVTTNQAHIFRSTDGGTHWSELAVGYAHQPAYYWTPDWFRWGTAALVIDPNDAEGRRVWKTDGFGVSRTDMADSPRPEWTTVMDGLEELVVQVIKAPPDPAGAQIVTGAADAEGFVHASVDTVPDRKLDPGHTAVSMVTSIDYVQSDTRHLVYVGWDETNPAVALSGVSSDGGRTWAPFGSTAPGRAGIIAISASDPLNMVWSPKNNGAGGAPVPVQFTKDGGKTWNPAKGLPANAFYRASEWWNGQTLASDRVDGPRFYYLSQGQDGVVSFWISTDGGATWNRSPARLEDAPSWNVCPMIKPNPYVAGDVWLTFCHEDDGRAGHPLYRSTDGGMTFHTLPAMGTVYNIAFGKGDVDKTPWVYVFGRSDGATRDGIWQSKDLGTTWRLVSDPDTQQFGTLTYIEGDLRRRNRVYIGTSGRGAFVGDGGE